MNDDKESPIPDSIHPAELAPDSPQSDDQQLQPDVNAVNNIPVETGLLEDELIESAPTTTEVAAESDPTTETPVGQSGNEAIADATAESIDQTSDAVESPGLPPAAPSGATSPPSVEPVVVAASDTAKTPPSNTKLIIFAALSMLLIVAAAAVVLLIFNDKTPETTVSNSSTQPAQDSNAERLGVSVTIADGEAEYSKDGSNWQKLDTQTQVAEGTQLRTAADSRVVLTLDDGSAIRLDSKSHISINSLRAGDIIISQHEGETYSRIVQSDRSYTIKADGTAYKALGTAFSTISTPKEKGVRVYQSSVDISGLEPAVAEGSQYYRVNPNKSLAGKVTKMDVDSLLDSEFVRWNLEEDEKSQLFKDHLGVLKQAKKEAEEKAKKAEEDRKRAEESARQAREQEAETARRIKEEAERKNKTKKESKKDKYSNGKKVTRGKITATKQSSNKVTWNYTGNSPYGFKLVYSRDNRDPQFENSASVYYNHPSASSGELPKKNTEKGKTYYARICAYTAGTESDKCVDYSNVIELSIRR